MSGIDLFNNEFTNLQRNNNHGYSDLNISVNLYKVSTLF